MAADHNINCLKLQRMGASPEEASQLVAFGQDLSPLIQELEALAVKYGAPLAEAALRAALNHFLPWLTPLVPPQS